MFRVAAAFLLAAVAVQADVAVAPRASVASAKLVFDAAAASDGGGFVVAVQSSRGIDLSHVTRAGERNSVPGLRGDVFLRDLAATRDGYLLAYGSQEGLRVADLDTNGTLRSDRIVSWGAGFIHASLASREDQALLVTDSGTALFLDTHGNVVRPITLFDTAEHRDVAVAASDDGFALVWRTNDSKLHAGFVHDGALAPIALGTSSAAPAIASDGETFLVAFADGDDLKSIVLGGDGPALVIAHGKDIQHPRIAWDGSAYIVVFESGSEVYTVRAGGQPEPLATRFGSDRRQNLPDVASSGAGTLFTWRDQAFCGFTAAAKVAGVLEGARDRELLLTPGPASQFGPIVVPRGDDFAVAWLEQDDRTRTRVRFGTRTIELSDDAGGEMPAIAFGDGSMFVAWVEQGVENCEWRILGAAIDAEGIARVGLVGNDAEPGARPSVTWNGSEFVVVWERAATTELVAVRLSASGVPLDLTPRVLKAGEPPLGSWYVNRALYPRLVWNGAEYLLVWMRYRSSEIPLYPDPPPIREVRTQRFARDLSPIADVAIFASEAAAPAATLGRDGVLIVWHDAHVRHARLISRDGVTLYDVTLGEQTAAVPVIAAQGDGFLVAVDRRVIRIDANGGTSLLSTLPAAARATGIAANGDRVVVAYDIVDGDGLRNAFVREISRRRRVAR